MKPWSKQMTIFWKQKKWSLSQLIFNNKEKIKKIVKSRNLYSHFSSTKMKRNETINFPMLNNSDIEIAKL